MFIQIYLYINKFMDETRADGICAQKTKRSLKIPFKLNFKTLKRRLKVCSKKHLSFVTEFIGLLSIQNILKHTFRHLHK